MRTPPERPADGVAGCVYESFVPGGLDRWMEKEILWFCFQGGAGENDIRLDGERLLLEGKAPGQCSELRMSSTCCPGFCPCRSKIRPGAFVPLCLRAIILGERPSGILFSFSAGRCRQYLLLPEVFAGTTAKCASGLRPLNVSTLRGGRPLSRPLMLPFTGNGMPFACAF